MTKMARGLIHGPQHPKAVPFGAAFGAPSAPDEIDYHAKMALDPTDAIGNDVWSCCVQAGYWRLAQMRMANAWGSSWRPTAAGVLRTYQAWTGTDTSVAKPPGPGTLVADAQRFVAVEGLDLGLQAPDVTLPVSVELHELRPAIALLGGVGLCLNMPPEWDDASITTWDVGGEGTEPHFVVSGCLLPDGTLMVISWGREIELPPPALQKYFVGATAGASRSWMETTGISPAGLDWNATMAELSAVQSA